LTEAALSAVLAGVLPSPVTVAPIRRLSGGASAELSAVDAVDGTGQAHELVLRRSPLGMAGGMSAGVAAEEAALRAASAAGVPVPSVVAFAGDEVLGDGYLMARLVGEALPGRLLRDEEYADSRRVLLEQAAGALAGIHAAAFDGVPVARLGAAEQLDGLEALHRSFGQAVPTFELALRWLRTRVPSDAPDVLVHGDFRMGNLLCDANGLVAVLDWELVHVGDAHEDLGWFCAPAWRFGGAGTAGGLGSRADLYAAYAAASGREVDPDRARFWEVLGTLKWGVICQVQAARVLTHGERSVEHALIGRRVSEVELDLLLLIHEGPLGAGDRDPLGGRVGRAATVSRPTHPTAAELLAVAAAQLEEDVLPGLEGRQKFVARVTARALGLVERELALGDRVAAIAQTPPEELARRIRDAEVDVDSVELHRQLAYAVLARLAIDNPAYPSLTDARALWPQVTAEVDGALRAGD